MRVIAHKSVLFLPVSRVGVEGLIHVHHAKHGTYPILLGDR
jgi:hypothetical protein